MSSPFYDAVRQAAPITEVLRLYGIELPEPHNNVARIPCPIHGGDRPNFCIFLDTNTWYCHSTCKRAGNVISLVADLDQTTYFEAGNKLAEFFHLSIPDHPPVTPEPHPFIEHPKRVSDHPAIRELVWKEDPKEIALFDLGYCYSGYFRGRVTFPIHDDQWQIVGYCGRARSPELEPKYLLSRGFQKGKVLYGIHQTTGDKVILVEGFRDVWRLWRFGLDAVAVIGSSLSREQADLLHRFSKVLILFDTDEPGCRGALQAGARLVSHPWVRIGYLWKKDPGDLDPDNANDRQWLTQLLWDVGYEGTSALARTPVA